MAEEKKEGKSKGARRYGNPPKIGEKKKPGEAKAEAGEAVDRGGDSGAIGKDANGAPGASAKPVESTPGAAPNPDVMAGTDGIAVQKRHMDEREEMSKRHAKEVHQMHSRHADEHAAMIEKHKNDFGAISDAAAPDGGSPVAAGGV